MNHVTVSGDRMTMTIRDGERVATLRSELPTGFTDEHIAKARTEWIGSTMQPGQVDRARLVRIVGAPVIITLNTGPPTWWWPRAELKRGKAMVGWLRLLIAVSWPT